MTETPKNLSGAIKRAREMHRAEIAERLERRQTAERQRLEQLNAVPRPAEAPTAPPVDAPAPETARAPVPAPEPPAVAPAVPSAESAAAPAEPRAVETLPTERYLKVRNAIFDDLARYLSGNQYKVYMEIYRETLGRRQPTPSGFFRPREMARELGIGSDQTVYRALKDLSDCGLLTCEARIGDTRGTRITLCAVETALERVRLKSPARRASGRKPTTVKITTVKNTEVIGTTVDQQQSPRYYSDDHDGTVVKITTLHDHERHARHGKTASTQRDDGGAGAARAAIVGELVARYGYSPRLARAAVDEVPDADVELVPFLLRRLDRAVERGQHRKGAVIQNPAGILSGWLADFGSWRTVLVADRDRAASAAVEAQPEAQDPYTEYLTEMDTAAAAEIDRLDAPTRERLERDARAELARTYPASADWPEEHWQRAILAHLKRSQFDRPSFEEWSARQTPRE
jgi:DNA-binding MarR family transcriptional regulator